jgi:hypothetical protein
LLNGKQTDRERRHETDGELSSFGDIAHVNTYVSLPLAQRRTQQMVDRFNAAEKLWHSLEAKRRSRRARHPEMPPEFHRQLDLLDFANAQLPQDCIGFVVEPNEAMPRTERTRAALLVAQ